MAQRRILPMPGESVSEGTKKYSTAYPRNRQRESSQGPPIGAGGKSDPRYQCLHGPDFTMRELSSKKVD